MRAHLLRGVLYLLLLLAVCIIPFALSQQRSIQRTVSPKAQSRVAASPNGCGLDWRVVAGPNSSANTNILFGVGGLSFSFYPIWAVGSYYDESFTSQTLIEQWNGSAWVIQSSPNPGSTGNQLNAVGVAGGTGDVWAVGYFTDDNSIAHTLIEHWDGTSWSVVPSPSSGNNGSYLQSVTAEWAVGYYIDDNLVNQTLVEHWDGQSWTIIPSPNRGTDGSQLNGVARGVLNDVWAVGYSGQGNGAQTLIEHWNGSAWTIVDSPNPGTSGNYLQAVAQIPTSPFDVWAVGYYYESGRPRTLIERWDGASWQVVPSPNVGTLGNSLFGVSGFSVNDVWGVGAYNLDNQKGTLQTLTEHWEGNAWNVVPSPNEGTADNILYATTYMRGSNWSVGTYSDGINGRTLTLQYSDPCVTPTPTPSSPPNTPTATPTPSGTPFSLCEVVSNGDFETGSFPPWLVDSSNPSPFVSNLQVHSGSFSAHLGSLPGNETSGDSSFYQTITVPATGGVLTFWCWLRSTDNINSDWQDVYVQDTSGVTLRVLFHACENGQTWGRADSLLSDFAGQTVRIKFLVHGDNDGNATDMFIDDVSLLEVCSPTPTPTARPTSTPRLRPTRAPRP
jgi:hypothetical protein